jgi:type IX secretion system PorP/SprF family membrane protein
MRKSAILIFLATVLSAQVAAQQVPVYGQYFVNPFLYNPAVAGTGDGARAYSVFRKQWVGIPGSPETQTLTLDGPANNNRMGLGLTLYNDMNNIMTRQGGMGTYAYHIPLATDHTLSVGLSLGFSRTTIAFDKLRAEDPFDQVILSSFDNGMAVDGNAGFSYRYKNLRIGGSALQLFQNNAIFSNDMGNQSLAYKFIRHYTASVQYKFELSPEIFELEPLVLIKSACW